MGSMFVNPLMLFGAAAIAAPIILFLLTRFRTKRVEWAAIIFLQRAMKKQQRRLRLENLILLLIRCLLLILLALALARPRSVSDVLVKDDEVSKNVVIVVDTSYSMAYQLGSDTVFEKAIRAARDLVTGLADGDRVTVVAYDENVRTLYPKPRQLNTRVKNEILQDLEDAPELQLSQHATDLAEVFHTLPRVLRAFDFDASGRPPPPGAPPLPKTIFLVTDAQRLGVLDPSGRLLDRNLPGRASEIKELGGNVILVDCGADEPKNVTVTHLSTVEAVVGKGLPCHIEAIVRNRSSVAINDLTVEYYVDNAQTPQKTVSLSVPAEEERAPDPLRYVFRKAGTHRVELRVKSDALTLDNRRHFVVDVREHVRVLLVDGEPSRDRWESETDFVAEVLSLSQFPREDGFGLLHPERVSESGLTGRKLSDYSVVIVSNVATLGDESVAALEDYTRAGGAVIFTLGSLIDVQAYNDGVWREGAGLFPARLLEVVGGTRAEAAVDEEAPAWVMALGDAEHHAVSLFRSEEMSSWLRMPSIFGYMRVDLGKDKEEDPEGSQNPVWVPLKVLTRSVDDAPDALPDAQTPGQPLLVEKAFGRGRSMVWLSSVDYAWNNCVLYDGFYVPFWRQMVLDLAQRTRTTTNLPIGGRYERHLRAEEFASRVEVLSPTGQREAVVLTKLGEQELYQLTYPDDDERNGLQESGFYEVARSEVAGSDTPEPDFFSVSIDPGEGDLAKFSAQELAEALEIPVEPIEAEGARDALQAEGGAGGTQEYWREFLAAVIALLVLESILAAVFGRRRR